MDELDKPQTGIRAVTAAPKYLVEIHLSRTNGMFSMARLISIDKDGEMK